MLTSELLLMEIIAQSAALSIKNLPDVTKIVISGIEICIYKNSEKYLEQNQENYAGYAENACNNGVQPAYAERKAYKFAKEIENE